MSRKASKSVKPVKSVKRTAKTQAIIQDLRNNMSVKEVATKYGISVPYAYTLRWEEGLSKTRRRKKHGVKTKAERTVVPAPVLEPVPTPPSEPVAKIVYEVPPPRPTLWQRVKAVFAPA